MHYFDSGRGTMKSPKAFTIFEGREHFMRTSPAQCPPWRRIDRYNRFLIEFLVFREVLYCFVVWRSLRILVMFLSAIVHCEANEYGVPKHPISEDTRMFFILLKYIKPLNEVDQFVPPHVDFLKKCYEQDAFVFSGPQNLRAGGLILANNDSLEAVWNLIKKDPFLHQ